jgi:hypothetical protein
MSVMPFTEVDDAIAAVEGFNREIRKFDLAVADNLQDAIGLQMAQIADRALARGWEPISFVQKDGFRLYRFKAMR